MRLCALADGFEEEVLEGGVLLGGGDGVGGDGVGVAEGAGPDDVVELVAVDCPAAVFEVVAGGAFGVEVPDLGGAAVGVVVDGVDSVAADVAAAADAAEGAVAGDDEGALPVGRLSARVPPRMGVLVSVQVPARIWPVTPARVGARVWARVGVVWLVGWGRCGAFTGGAVVDETAGEGVGDGVAPDGVGGVVGVGVGVGVAVAGGGVCGGDLAGDVGDDGAPAGEVGGLVGQPHQGGQVAGQLDHTAPADRAGAGPGARQH